MRHPNWLPILLATGLCVGSFSGFGQKQEPVSVRKEQLTVDAIRAAQVDNDQTFHVFNQRYKGVKGTPFLTKAWQRADLRLQDNRVLSNVPIKYDLMGNTLFAIRPTGDSIILASGLVKEFVIHDIQTTPVAKEVDRVYRRYAFRQGSKVLDGYFEVLAEGKEVVLLKWIKKEVTKFNKDVSSYTSQSGYDEIDNKIEYYIFAADGKAVTLKPNRKALDKALEELGVANRQALVASNAAVRSEQELVSAFQLAASH